MDSQSQEFGEREGQVREQAKKIHGCTEAIDGKDIFDKVRRILID